MKQFHRIIQKNKFSTIKQKITERDVKKQLLIKERNSLGWMSTYYNAWLYNEESIAQLPIKEKIPIRHLTLRYEQIRFLNSERLNKILFNYNRFETNIFNQLIFGWVSEQTGRELLNFKDGFVVILESTKVFFIIRIRTRYLLISQDQDAVFNDDFRDY